jgi:hypothetical protein
MVVRACLRKTPTKQTIVNPTSWESKRGRRERAYKPDEGALEWNTRAYEYVGEEEEEADVHLEMVRLRRDEGSTQRDEKFCPCCVHHLVHKHTCTQRTEIAYQIQRIPSFEKRACEKKGLDRMECN